MALHLLLDQPYQLVSMTTNPNQCQSWSVCIHLHCLRNWLPVYHSDMDLHSTYISNWYLRVHFYLHCHIFVPVNTSLSDTTNITAAGQITITVKYWLVRDRSSLQHTTRTPWLNLVVMDESLYYNSTQNFIFYLPDQMQVRLGHYQSRVWFA